MLSGLPSKETENKNNGADKKQTLENHCFHHLNSGDELLRMEADLAIDLTDQIDFIHNVCYYTQVIDISDLEVKARIAQLFKILSIEPPTCEMRDHKEI